MVNIELVGLILPPIIDFINTRITDSRVRWVVSVVICALVGVLLNIGELDLADWAKSSSVIFLSAQAAYKLYWEKSQARETLTKTLK